MYPQADTETALYTELPKQVKPVNHQARQSTTHFEAGKEPLGFKGRTLLTWFNYLKKGLKARGFFKQSQVEPYLFC